MPGPSPITITKIDETQINQITKRLDAVIRLLSATLPESMKQQDKIQMLSELGLQPKEIASMLGTTSNAVRVTLHEIRKRSSAVQPPPSSDITVPDQDKGQPM